MGRIWSEDGTVGWRGFGVKERTVGWGGFGVKWDGESWRIWGEGSARAPSGFRNLGKPRRDQGSCVVLGARCHSRLLSPPQEDSRNYLTLVEQYGDGLLVCGTGACAPTCWNVVRTLPPSLLGKTRPDPTQDPFLSSPDPEEGEPTLGWERDRSVHP